MHNVADEMNIREDPDHTAPRRTVYAGTSVFALVNLSISVHEPQIMRKPDFRLCTADQHLCFRYTDSIAPTLLISKISTFILFLRLYRPVYVSPVPKTGICAPLLVCILTSSCTRVFILCLLKNTTLVTCGLL